jgi:N-acetylglutamate synthase-like GNAT family acetyltransferase
MSLSIRKAEKKDRFAIRAMVYRACLNPFSLDWRQFVVAEADSRVIGIRQVRILKDGTREVASGVVVPTFRRRGVGRRLLEALLERESGPLYLMCDGKWAHYYREFGFQLVDLRDLPSSFLREHRILKAVFETASRLFLGEKMRLVTMKRAGSDEHPR